VARHSVLYVANARNHQFLAPGHMNASRYYELSWSLSCTFKNLRSRLPVMLDYMSSNGCEWIVKISPQCKPGSYVEVLITREGNFWPVLIVDTDLADEKRLDMDQRELTPNFEWEWPSVPKPNSAISFDETLNFSGAISRTAVQSLRRVFDIEFDDALEVKLFNVRSHPG
jgi:hypothetical protein